MTQGFYNSLLYKVDDIFREDNATTAESGVQRSLDHYTNVLISFTDRI